MVCTSLALYIVFADNLERIKHITTLHSLSDQIGKSFMQFISIFSLSSSENGSPKKTYKFLGFLPVIIGFIFLFGILGFGTADKWIESGQPRHLWLNNIWHHQVQVNDSILGPLGFTDGSQVKSKIRIDAFHKTFSPSLADYELIDDKDVMQLYYHAKHELWQDERQVAYIRKSQALSEYSRVFAFGFYILIVGGFINLFLMALRAPWMSPTEKDESGHRTPNIVNIPNLMIVIMLVISAASILSLVSVWDYLFSTPFKPIKIPVGLIVLTGSLGIFLIPFKPYRRLRFSFFIYSMLYTVSIVGYFVSCTIWVDSEKKVAKKVFGLYKSMHVTEEVKEIKVAKDVLHLDVVEEAASDSAR